MPVFYSQFDEYNSIISLQPELNFNRILVKVLFVTHFLCKRRNKQFR